jgi:hypothetical protein
MALIVSEEVTVLPSCQSAKRFGVRRLAPRVLRWYVVGRVEAHNGNSG